MGFASVYLKERTLFPELIKEPSQADTGIIVVVPSCGEQAITKMLDSLASCIEPQCGIEVIIIVNAPFNASASILDINRRTLRETEIWKTANARSFIRVYPVFADTSRFRKWGVGMARKTGMDEAVRRFDALERPNGIILSLDADCTVERYYFRRVYEGMFADCFKSACSIYFEHPLAGSEFPAAVYQAIVLYELHLRYYYQGLCFSGFPDAHHSLGSAIAVKALPYIRSGGMNRRIAGEDFYFVQKLVSAGGYFNLNTTAIYPSPRPSARVPFGTGPTIARLTENGKGEFLTYNPHAFYELRLLFSMTDQLYDFGSQVNSYLYSKLPQSLRIFIDINEWSHTLCEIKSNTASLKSFRKRFFNWFNMFRIVKYMNLVHRDHMKKVPITQAASELICELGYDYTSDEPALLLNNYRLLEKEF